MSDFNVADVRFNDENGSITFTDVNVIKFSNKLKFLDMNDDLLTAFKNGEEFQLKLELIQDFATGNYKNTFYLELKSVLDNVDDKSFQFDFNSIEFVAK